MFMQVISTVIAAAQTYDLTTLAAVKDELSITTNVSDATLKRYITGASFAAAQECNRVFPVESLSDAFIRKADANSYLFFKQASPLQLSRWPIVAVTSVVEGTTTLTKDTDFLVDGANGQLIRLNSNGCPTAWCVPPTASYSAGFDPIPADLEDAVIRMVTKRWSAKGRDATLKEENIPGVIERQFWIATGADAGNLTPDIADILDNYRVPVLA